MTSQRHTKQLSAYCGASNRWPTSSRRPPRACAADPLSAGLVASAASPNPRRIGEAMTWINELAVADKHPEQVVHLGVGAVLIGEPRQAIAALAAAFTAGEAHLDVGIRGEAVAAHDGIINGTSGRDQAARLRSGDVVTRTALSCAITMCSTSPGRPIAS
jgi:hypothetical protein